MFFYLFVFYDGCFYLNKESRYANEFNETPMWLNIFKIHYNDLQIDDFDVDVQYYFELTKKFFVENMRDELVTRHPDLQAIHVPDTEKQSESDAWVEHRQFRTASVCKKVVQLGENFDRLQCYAWLRDNLWSRKSC